MSSSKSLLIISFTISILMLAQCTSKKSVIPGAASGKYIEVFFLSETTNQYFIHPIEWKDGGITFSIDFTVRTSRKALPNDPVSFSYTLEKNEPFNDELVLYFVLNDTTAVAPSLVESLASEDNKSYVRYTSQIEYGDFIKLISAKRVDIILLDGMNDTRSKLPKQFYRAADEMKKILNIQN